ncbi:uncharacterized protein [Halyomorpha halys]|uniref:uncharacterized protein isoform X2 n=1 Tax=Halyomorpha halys TaxID=286706 RepID=UPI0006D4EF53|nr:uncharacterized protein LOC106681105 isoform X2 [Halyomorpha halys]
MYSLFLMCCFVTFGSVSSSDLLLKTYNKCDCFNYDQCSIPHKPTCSVEDENYEDLYQENSASSKSPELCGMGFLFKKESENIKSKNGTLKMSVILALPMYENKFEVELRYQNQCLGIGKNSLFKMLDLKHSSKYISVPGSSLDSCNEAVEISFPYVFSGCYQLFIKQPSIRYGCMSRPFLIASSYKKTPLNTMHMRHDLSYYSQSEILKYVTVGEGLNESKSIRILLLNTNCSEDVVKEARLTSVNKNECCYGHDYTKDQEMSPCPCKWENNTSIECRFREIKNGNYCAIVQFIDPRCDRTSLWIGKHEADCSWSADKVAQGKITPTEVIANDVNSTQHNNSYLIIIYCLFVLIITAAIMFTVIYFKKEKKKGRPYIIDIVENSCFISKGEKILLLYPRDCERFMTAMTKFRMILKESCGCKVHDAWDEESFDKVAESIETWSWPLIQDENTKIIVILTECSKIIEESYIGDDHFATYRDPKAFDKVFAQSVKALNEYFATRSDSYQRVFVVRLDETPVIDFSFHFNPATIYILPYGLQTLVNDLQSGYSTPINKESQLELKAAIHDYQVYKQQYTNYLNDILNINNNCKIIKSLKNGIIR